MALPAPIRQALTLDEFQQIALVNNPTLGAAEALVTQQQGILRQETLYPNPTAGYVRTDANQTGQSQTAGVFLGQQFVTAGKLRIAGMAARSEVDWRRWQLDAQRGRVLNDVRIRFYEALGAQQTLETSEELEKSALKGLNLAEELVKAKVAARPDVLQARIQLNAIRTSVRDARYRYEAAWKQLVNVAGVPQMEPSPLSGSLEDGYPEFDWDQTLARLLSASPVLKAQEALIQAARADLRLARAESVPDVDVQLVAQHDRVLRYNSVSTLISLPVPIFNRNQGNRLNAVGDVAQQQKEYQRLQLALRDLLAGSFQQYLSARNQAETLRREILPDAEENLDLTTEAYKRGQYDFLRVLNARQTYFHTRLAYIEALVALRKISVEIEGLELTGGLNPTEVGTALQGEAGAGVRNVLLQQLQQRAAHSESLPGAFQAAPK